MHNPDPNRCKAACDGESRGRAWTYVKPGVQGPEARCWLKHRVPGANRGNCCVSGVKGGGGGAIGTRVIDNPTIAGTALDICRRWGQECGKPAADAYCRQAGYSRSVDHRVRGNAPPTRDISSGKICDAAFCGRINARFLRPLEKPPT